jgi:hypothetical protein
MSKNPVDYISDRRSIPWIASLIFVLSCLVYWLSPQSKPLYTNLIEGAEMAHVGISLAQHGTFSDPFYARPTGPTAHTPPLYVLLYSAVAKEFGVGMTGVWILTALNIGFVALQLALLPVLSDRLGLGSLSGALAAIFGLLIQPYRVLVGWESLLMGALLVGLCILTWSNFKMPGRWWRSLLLGSLWGAAILTNPECVLLFLAWAHVAAMENEPEQLSRSRRAMLVALAGAALICLPWFVRNFNQFHSVFFVRDNFGLELYTSNNRCALPTMLENFLSGCHVMTHPNGNPFLAADVAREGEIRFNQEMLRGALSWITENPRKFGWLTERRFFRYWFPYLGSFRYSIPMGTLTVLSLGGLALMFRERRQAALLLASTLCVYPFVHYFVQFEARYRYPIFWATLLPASYALVKIISWPRKRGAPAASGIKEETELTPA